MAGPDTLEINAPALPKGGGAIQSIGKGWGSVGTSGEASSELPLPISAGRGFAPGLALHYGSQSGTGSFGLGWQLSQPRISRRTDRGAPAYNQEDVFLGPSGIEWLPERDAHGALVHTVVEKYLDLDLGNRYQVTRYFPRIESTFDLIEHWAEPDDVGFWLIHGADGTLNLYGYNAAARVYDPAQPQHVAEWLLQETVTPHGEHLLFQYKREDGAGITPDSPRDQQAQCYLERVSYGNADAEAHLLLWTVQPMDWHFVLLFDYGERTTALDTTPSFEPEQPWSVRSDPHSSYARGFEVRTWRQCQQVLMFHHFPNEPAMGAEPVLISRLLLEYSATELGFSYLSAAHSQGFDSAGKPALLPPMEFSYSDFNRSDLQFSEFEAMPGLNDGQQYSLVDLYGEGLPGVLYKQDNAWYYRAPKRAEPAAHADEVAYDDWQLLPRIPVADSAKAVHQSLTDITGDGRLDWLVAQPGLSGFFTLAPDGNWFGFAPFSAFPQEFFHPMAQLTDLLGDGLLDVAMIGTRSVRLYANQRRKGFGQAIEVERATDDDALPIISNSPTELVAFSDPLGSGRQHLIRLRHNELRCWPNLGRGRFGKSFVFASLPFSYEDFNAAQLLLADLDGSGAVDLIYLHSTHAQIFMNLGGNGFAPPQTLNWPDGVRYDNLCQVSTADLQGLGCSSLILTVPHMIPRHWRCDFVAAKPYLLCGTNNNMGAQGEVTFRSSAQCWLDEKAERLAAGKPAVSRLPLAVHLVSRQVQFDEITGNRFAQHFTYRKGFYDGDERKFRGFGQLISVDTDVNTQTPEAPGYTAPVLTKTWFHTGSAINEFPDDYDASDTDAMTLGPTLLTRYRGPDLPDETVTDANAATLKEMARALSGSTLRVEVFGQDDSSQSIYPYTVQQSRLGMRLLQPVSAHQVYASLLPISLESLSYQYERQPDDPLCQQAIHLVQDAYGYPTHSATVHHARRKSADDTPPFATDHENRWWGDAHDEAQEFYYLTEVRAQHIHLNTAQSWRLGLPYRSRGNALVIGKNDLPATELSYERFIAIDGPLHAEAERVLTSLSIQRYQQAGDGEATFIALPAPTEAAELDKTAMAAYDRVMTVEALRVKLAEVGYKPMPAFFPDDPAVELWSTTKGFATFAGPEQFYKLLKVKLTDYLGETEVEYDPYHLLPVKVTTADGCATVATHDYRFLAPTRILDPNQNTQEVIYDAFGAPRANSFYGTELGLPVGFAPIDEYDPRIEDPAHAIADGTAALQDAASASFVNRFSWMGQLPEALRNDPHLMALRLKQRDVLPNGYVRASARHRQGDAEWTRQLAAVHREPVHGVMLQADRYPGDPEKQIRMAITCSDGFGRTLQSKQLVEPGTALKVNEDGSLAVEDGKPVNIEVEQRWRVSERVEFNNKGLAIRTYRPYFASAYRYINDESFREHGYSDQQFYDPLGRPTLTITAKGHWRRQTYSCPWYGIAEDENDLEEERLAHEALRDGQ